MTLLGTFSLRPHNRLWEVLRSPALRGRGSWLGCSLGLPDISNGKYPLPLLKSSLSAFRASLMKQNVFSCIHVTTRASSYPLGSRAHDLQTGPCNSVAFPSWSSNCLSHSQCLSHTAEAWTLLSGDTGLGWWKLQLPKLSRCLTHTRCECCCFTQLTHCLVHCG